jgi:hypothetical protein
MVLANRSHVAKLIASPPPGQKMGSNASRTFEELVRSYPADVEALASAARQSLRKWLPRVEESVDATIALIGYGYGPGYRGVVCTLILSKSGVKLGLVRGSELADPHGLLEGSGKVHKYIQLRAASDLRKPGVRELVKATHVAWKERTQATASVSLRAKR